ncbi:hypothetical protein DFH08DRAFT_1087291 [Mycena albidolilacea]|uniref:Uncharacterized protein n=1 Tax=Mycena albidolilacea TaxID=1033008 RepID=A0AAD6ZA94_9AGAR|nr:hypothetical protein DFH08DRAFT_1087291 [Mycena albidolilacea]
MLPLWLSVLGSLVAVRAASGFSSGVLATGTLGSTDPPAPTLPTIINQTSVARLLSVNDIHDFCIFAPREAGTLVGDSESDEVAWCTLPRNNARVIPDGTFTGLAFLTTPFYLQVLGFGDLTKLNIAAGDAGGQLNPHGPDGRGLPVGGNVTSAALGGSDAFFAEWLLILSASQFCLRVCTGASAQFRAADMCRTDLDLLGCAFLMPADYAAVDKTFKSCDADAGLPPGWYASGSGGGFSVYTEPLPPITVAPPLPAPPSASNCRTVASVSNGIAPSALTAGAVGTALPSGFGPSSGSSASAGSSSGGSTNTASASQPTNTNTDTNTNTAKHHNAAGAIAGGVIGGGVLAVMLALLGWWCLRRRNTRLQDLHVEKHGADHNPDPAPHRNAPDPKQQQQQQPFLAVPVSAALAGARTKRADEDGEREFSPWDAEEETPGSGPSRASAGTAPAGADPESNGAAKGKGREPVVLRWEPPSPRVREPPVFPAARDATELTPQRPPQTPAPAPAETQTQRERALEEEVRRLREQLAGSSPPAYDA